MGNLNLDDVLGFFRELVDPNFSDFYWDYQSNEECSRDKLVRVFRKMVNLCLTLNHQVDKVAKKLEYNSPQELIVEIFKHYPAEGKALDTIRKFTNDVKHKSKLDQYYSTRKRNHLDQPPIGAELPEWYFITPDGDKAAVCESSVTAYLFWGKYLGGERELLSKK